MTDRPTVGGEIGWKRGQPREPPNTKQPTKPAGADNNHNERAAKTTDHETITDVGEPIKRLAVKLRWLALLYKFSWAKRKRNKQSSFGNPNEQSSNKQAPGGSIRLKEPTRKVGIANRLAVRSG